ncbi:MAG TPA: hypothetical protein VIV10_08580 [Gemmatimonadales bacterium]
MSRRIVFVVVALAALAVPVRGQTLRQQVRQLFTFGRCGQVVCLDTTVLFGHGLHYIPASEAVGTTLITFLSTSIGISVSNTPVSSASSGTSFRFEGGIPVKTTTSAGPVFGERAQTLGRGRWFVGFGVTAIDFARLRGVPLDDITLTLPHQDVNVPGFPRDTLGAPAFENDVIAVRTHMNVRVMVGSVSLNYGVVDGVDVGVSIPVVRTSVSGQSTATIVLVGGDTLHRFAGTGSSPVLTSTSSVDASATGLGDIEGRLKVNVAQTDRFGIALVGFARFPTGNADDLLGAGRFSGRAIGVVSARFGDFNPHANVGITVRDATDQNNSVEANAGFDALVSSSTTMAFDLLGSWLVGRQKVDVPASVVYLAAPRRTLAVTNIPSRQDDLLTLSLGFKFRTSGGVQIVTNALMPLRDSGLQPSVMWTGGVEFTF